MHLISFTRDGRIRSGGIEGVTDPSAMRVIDLNAADPRLPADMLSCFAAVTNSWTWPVRSSRAHPPNCGWR